MLMRPRQAEKSTNSRTVPRVYTEQGANTLRNASNVSNEVHQLDDYWKRFYPRDSEQVDVKQRDEVEGNLLILFRMFLCHSFLPFTFECHYRQIERRLAGHQ